MGATNPRGPRPPSCGGRFDRQVLVDKLDINGREEVLRIHSKAVRLSTDVDVKIVAARTAGFAGADLADLVNEAALLAARKDKSHVEMRDFDDAIDRLIAGLERSGDEPEGARDRRLPRGRPRGRRHRAQRHGPGAQDPIVQRGFGALGYTMQLPLEDRYLMQRRDLHNQLAVSSAGGRPRRSRSARSPPRRRTICSARPTSPEPW